jgi:transposase
MISVEAWTTIRYLKAQGLGTRKIAKQVGVARNTVKQAVRSERLPKYERPPRPNPKLEPLRDVIREMLTNDHFIGSRILKEIRIMGYDGSQMAFYRFLAKLKAKEGKNKACIRYETSPGQQGQFDWSPYTVPIGGCLTRVIVFRLILGFSRRKRHFASLNEKQASVFEGIEYGLWKFGGTPKELVVDNASVFVVNAHPAYFKWNPRFLELCGHYSMKPIACRVGNPRAKGKVERPFYYLEQHFIKGHSFDSFEHFSKELSRFDDELDSQVHQTTQERPIDRFDWEKDYLTPLPSGRFVSSQELFRHVSWDGLVSFGGNRYSLPPGYAGNDVWMRTSQGTYLEVYGQKGNLIFRHTLSQKKGVTILVEEHYAQLKQRLCRTKAVLEREFLEKFPDERDFLEKLYAQQKLNPVFHLKPILELATIYPREALTRAFALAKEYNTFSCHFIRGLLEKETPQETAPEPGANSLWSVPAITVKANLSTYQRLMEVKS